jgi:hypothetical protein
MSIADIAVTVHYNVAVPLGAAVRQIAKDAGVVFSPWHPGQARFPEARTANHFTR